MRVRAPARSSRSVASRSAERFSCILDQRRVERGEKYSDIGIDAGAQLLIDKGGGVFLGAGPGQNPVSLAFWRGIGWDPVRPRKIRPQTVGPPSRRAGGRCTSPRVPDHYVPGCCFPGRTGPHRRRTVPMGINCRLNRHMTRRRCRVTDAAFDDYPPHCAPAILPRLGFRSRPRRVAEPAARFRRSRRPRMHPTKRRGLRRQQAAFGDVVRGDPSMSPAMSREIRPECPLPSCGIGGAAAGSKPVDTVSARSLGIAMRRAAINGRRIKARALGRAGVRGIARDALDQLRVLPARAHDGTLGERTGRARLLLTT